MANMWKCLINPKMLQKARGLSMIMLKLRMFTLQVCIYVSFNTHSKCIYLNIFVSRKNAGQKYFQIFSRIYGFAFKVREKN